jgi:allophanate hydrolase
MRAARRGGGSGVPRGGLVGVGVGGHAIEVELHDVPTACVGTLLGALPPPLALGTIWLAEGDVLGMVCTDASAGTVDVSVWGSRPASLAAVEAGAASG